MLYMLKYAEMLGQNEQHGVELIKTDKFSFEFSHPVNQLKKRKCKSH